MAIEDVSRLAADYEQASVQIVRRTCLEIATRLGDYYEEMCVVGGLVPSLLIDQVNREGGIPEHIGTIDLDLGLSIVILDDRRYEEIAGRLSEAGFNPDRNHRGNPTSQRWRSRQGVTVDFLIPPCTDGTDKPGSLRNLEDTFAAIITPGLDLAFVDYECVTICDKLASGGRAERKVKVCGPGAYVVLKCLAFANRGKPKDAYDMYYVLRNYAAGIESIVHRTQAFRDRRETKDAIRILNRDFKEMDSIGPVSVAQFLGVQSEEVQADVAGFARALLDRLA